MNFNWFIHARTFNGISHLNSLKNSRDIAISVGWTERPSHHDIKYMNSQKSHLTGNFLIFLYLLKLNLMSPMAKSPNKGKINILYYVLYCKKGDFLYFFWAKKIYWIKKHLSQKVKELRICTIFDIWQFSLRLMALRYMGKLLIVWKYAYSGFLDFLGQISSCKIGVKKDNKSTFFSALRL